MNFRFNLEQVYKKGFSQKAKKLKTEGKPIPKSYYHDSETAIYISCSFQGYTKIHAGVRIKPFDYDVENQKVKTRDQRSMEMQLLLNKIKDSCMIQFMEAKRNGKKLTKFHIREMMISAVGSKGEEESIDFFEIMDEFYTWKSKHVVGKTLTRYAVFKRYLKEFQTKRRSKLSIEELDQRLAESFTDYLISEKNLVQNTYIKYLKLLRAFGRFCLEHDYSDSTRYKQIKTTGHLTSVFVLTIDETEAIANLELNDPVLNEVRDSFMFLVYTGQRFGDLCELRWRDIVKEGDYTFWELYPIKTKTKCVRVPLLPEAIELIQQRQGKPDDKIFNTPSNQKSNYLIKKIAKQAKIKGEFTTIRKQGHKTIKIVQSRASKVSMHCARRTFITSALVRGMSIQNVKAISLHSSFAQMSPYINIADKYVAEQLLSTHSKTKDK